ncbi:hypothetical protein [Mangrovibacterium lignilyticum]|uniref:hypothetical protein n=1 Tax=Mangrovibacterium lignilyticum TaxID=2668052 RepID=UPI0013D0BB36|nr:hypothetical protein [Mangrovibacterium lignilyticum]
MAQIPKSTVFVRLLEAIAWLNKHINFMMGSLSGVLTGSIVFLINYDHGFSPALYSFFRQFLFNLLIGGFNIRVCEKITQLVQAKNTAIMMATIVPSIQAWVILYSIHYFGNTPKPLASTYWQFGVNLIAFFFMALFYRDALESKQLIISTLKKFMQKK